MIAPEDTALPELTDEHGWSELRIQSLQEELFKDDQEVFDNVTRTLWEFVGVMELADETQAFPDEVDAENAATEALPFIIRQVAEQFATVLLRSDIDLERTQNQVEPVDLTREGTHKVKRFNVYALNPRGGDMYNHLRRALWVFVLTTVHTRAEAA